MPRRSKSKSPAPEASAPTPTAPEQKATPKAHGDAVLTGVTLDGKTRFKVPDTPTTLEALAHWYSLPSLTTIALFAASIYFALPPHSKYLIIAIACFWRFAYDGILGFILHQQSKTAFLTNWVKDVQSRPDSLMHTILSSLIDTTMGKGHNSLADPSLYVFSILPRPPRLLPAN